MWETVNFWDSTLFFQNRWDVTDKLEVVLFPPKQWDQTDIENICT